MTLKTEIAGKHGKKQSEERWFLGRNGFSINGTE